MEYASRVLLEVNGQSIDDFNSVTEKEVEVAKKVRLMNKVGVVTTLEEYGISVDYVVPLDAPEFDFRTVNNGTLTIDLNNGVRKVYTGVYVLKIGDTKYDGEKEATRNIEFFATKKN